MPARTLLTTRQAAALLGYHEEYFRSLWRQGEFSPVMQAGRSYLWAESALKAWAKKRGRGLRGDTTGA
jgi:excisionase family DNA binding protein